MTDGCNSRCPLVQKERCTITIAMTDPIQAAMLLLPVDRTGAKPKWKLSVKMPAPPPQRLL